MQTRPESWDWEFAFAGTVVKCEHRERPRVTHTVLVMQNGNVVERQTFTERDSAKAI